MKLDIFEGDLEIRKKLNSLKDNDFLTLYGNINR